MQSWGCPCWGPSGRGRLALSNPRAPALSFPPGCSRQFMLDAYSLPWPPPTQAHAQDSALPLSHLDALHLIMLGRGMQQCAAPTLPVQCTLVAPHVQPPLQLPCMTWMQQQEYPTASGAQHTRCGGQKGRRWPCAAAPPLAADHKAGLPSAPAPPDDRFGWSLLLQIGQRIAFAGAAADACCSPSAASCQGSSSTSFEAPHPIPLLYMGWGEWAGPRRAVVEAASDPVQC